MDNQTNPGQVSQMLGRINVGKVNLSVTEELHGIAGTPLYDIVAHFFIVFF